MKKLIVFNNGHKKIMNIEEIIYAFRGLACKTFLMLTKSNVVTEDDKQELDIVIFKTFQTYDEQHCFSTHLVWNIKRYVKEVNNKKFCDKRNLKGCIMLNLDYCISDDGDMKLYEQIGNDCIDLENIITDRELLRFLNLHLNDLEKQLLNVNLDVITITHLSKLIDKTPQNISNMNARFKKKLLKIMEKYYDNKLTM